MNLYQTKYRLKDPNQVYHSHVWAPDLPTASKIVAARGLREEVTHAWPAAYGGTLVKPPASVIFDTSMRRMGRKSHIDVVHALTVLVYLRGAMMDADGCVFLVSDAFSDGGWFHQAVHHLDSLERGVGHEGPEPWLSTLVEIREVENEVPGYLQQPWTAELVLAEVLRNREAGINDDGTLTVATGLSYADAFGQRARR